MIAGSLPVGLRDVYIHLKRLHHDVVIFVTSES
jgi:hypothetical protein